MPGQCEPGSAQPGWAQYSTFLAAMTSDHIELTDANIEWTFNKFDKDRSGYISLMNMKEVLGNEFDGTDVADLLKSADTDTFLGGKSSRLPVHASRRLLHGIGANWGRPSHDVILEESYGASLAACAQR